ncbi:MAG: SusC/RagA family TonB-linked outer membrane protein [Prolixibacteraceae bacterium]|jgi:TonB-linked SusC/RagA family outer membrane protein|nr:SusC/RagA family TonB-linked outer membrane protein [Prolixibacteraceae bacterium]
MKKKMYLILIVLFTTCASVMAQVKVNGTITDPDGNGIPGVTIVQKGTTNGTTSNTDGKYFVNVSSSNATLIFSFIGMKPVEEVVNGRTIIHVKMESVNVGIDEVVVTALGITRQSKALTYAAQNVKTDALAEARSLNVISGLSGKIAGLSITPSSTGVGAEAKVLLRGTRSIAGSSEPLYVVDGITLAGGISNLSPDDIESITVLKGANSAALYGSRANNGAIIITTKSGAGAKEGVTVNAGFTWQGSSAILLDHLQNTYGQGAKGIYAAGSTFSWGPEMTGQQVAHWTNNPDNELYGKTYPFSPQPDNVKDFFQRGNEYTSNIQVGINTAKSNAAFSYTNTDASGIVATNNLKGHNLGLRFGSKLSEKLTLDSKVNFIIQDFENQLPTGGAFASEYNNPMRYLYILPRNIRTQDVSEYTFLNAGGQNRQHFWKPNDNGTGNPYWILNNVQNPVKRQRVLSMVSLKYEIIKGLSIMARSAMDAAFAQSEEKFHNDTYIDAPKGKYSKSNSTSREWNSDVLLNYHKVISDFTLDLNGGANHKAYESQSVGGSGNNFFVENLFALSNTENPRPSEGFSKKVVNSAYGFAEFSYKNALFLNVTGRNDWSSTLPAANRSYFYPSVGLTAIVSDLIKFPSVFTHVKLRGSFAEVGNDTNPYSLDRSAQVLTGGLVLLGTTMPNANLKPETTRSLETGFDLRMVNDRIRLNFTYYKTNTFDQLFQVAVPSTSGVGAVFMNGADVQNKGLEITLGVGVVSKKDFSWDIDVNWSKNDSKILELAEGLKELEMGGTWIKRYKLVAGRPFGDQYTKGWLRNDKGEVIIQANGLPAITPGFTVNAANFNPDWLAGVSNSFRYKNFNLSFLVDIRQGGTFVSFTEAVTSGSGIQDYTTIGRAPGSLLFGRDVFKGEVGVNATTVDAVTTYTPNKTPTDAESFWNNIGGRNNPTGEPFVRSASNIRMREMILGYELPKNLVAKTFLSSARISLVGRNLFFIQNKGKYADPEVVKGTSNTLEGETEFALPTTRTYGVSLNFGF